MRKSINLYLLIFCALMLAIAGCASSERPKEKGLVVINVLSRELYDDCHIKGSISVPFEQVESYAQKNIDKQATIVLYCSNYLCTSSGHACKKLRSVGYERVYAYEGGTAEWYQQGLPVEGPCTKKYLHGKVAWQHTQEDADDYIISTQELAHKMGYKNKTAA